MHAMPGEALELQMAVSRHVGSSGRAASALSSRHKLCTQVSLQSFSEHMPCSFILLKEAFTEEQKVNFN